MHDPAVSTAEDAERRAVLAANAGFYAAFNAGDFTAMKACWAQALPVACIHPGWPALQGRESVMESWRRILMQPPQPTVCCVGPQVAVIGIVAMVTCYEQLGAGLLAATNLFGFEGGAWRMIHHQAGPTAPSAAILDETERQVVAAKLRGEAQMREAPPPDPKRRLH